MADLIIESHTGRKRPGLTDPPILTSEHQQWDGFSLRESGTTDASVEHGLLLKHAVSLQLDEPATIDWSAGDQRLNKLILPGQVSICPANAVYSSIYQHQGRHLSVFFEHQFILNAMGDANSSREFEFPWQIGIQSNILRDLILMLRAEAVEPRENNPTYATAIARLIALHLVEHHSDNGNRKARVGGMTPPSLRRVLKAIEEQSPGDITLTSLAAVAGLSVFHFARVFRQSTGLSPMQYVLRHRINSAKDLLLQSNSTINQIAIDCGFCDQAHLTRHFKRLTGTTPSAFRRAVGSRR